MSLISLAWPSPSHLGDVGQKSGGKDLDGFFFLERKGNVCMSNGEMLCYVMGSFLCCRMEEKITFLN
jgi:hypothetical protein